MSLREDNIEFLRLLNYGVEEESRGNNIGIHLYDNKYLYVDKFESHEELAKYIKDNLK